MAGTERVIDLENHRYADVIYAGTLQPSLAAEEQAKAERRLAAARRILARAAAGDELARDIIDLLQLEIPQ
jgi:hypothetical protein